MGKDKERAELLAKIEAAWPRYKENSELVRRVELASNVALRNHLAMSKMLDGSEQSKQELLLELSPRYSDCERAEAQRFFSMRLGYRHSTGYITAKDECGDWYSGPDWVPFNLHSTAGPCGGTPDERKCAQTLINAPGAEKLWTDIAERYSHNAITGEPQNSANAIALALPRACADAQARWAAIPRMTPSKFKEQRKELARRAEQLALELERFYLPRDPDDCEFPGLLDFRELMSQEEHDQFDQAIRFTTARIANRARNRAGVPSMDWEEYNDIGTQARALGYKPGDFHPDARIDAHEVYALMERDHTQPHLPYGGVPTLPDMMRRIAKKFEEDGDYPPIKNPNLGNAERNFFARALCKYFWTSYGDVSPAIVRDIVTMFYQQSITENDISQMVSKIKAAHPLPES